MVVDQIRGVLDYVSTTPKSEFVQPNRLGLAFGFSTAEGEIDQIISIYRSIKSTGWERAPFALLNNFLTDAKETMATFQKLVSFNPQAKDAAEEHQRLLRAISEAYQRSLLTALPFFVLPISSTEGLSLQATQLHYDSITSLKRMVEDGNRLLAEVQRIQKAATEGARDLAVESQAEYFDREAAAWMGDSRLWRTWIVILAIALGIVVALSYAMQGTSPACDSWICALLLFWPKVVLLSLLSFGVGWCVRNYGAAQHNVVVNRHRANALKTFRAFVNAASGPAIQDAVLMEAARSIFSQHISGFSAGEELQPASPFLGMLSGKG